MMCIHVDDFYVISTTNKMINEFVDIMKSEFGEIVIKSGNILDYLGMKVVKNSLDNSVTLSQPGYINKILNEVGFENLLVSKTPSAISETKQIGDDKLFNKNQYLKLIGLLNYLAVFTRPDILYALSVCAQHCTNPTYGDYRKVMRIFRYLKGTKDMGITFSNNENNNNSKMINLQVYVDASHNCYKDGKGHFGLNFSFGPNDGTFYAKSQKMKLVTLSSAESEYIALCEAATEIVFLRNLLNELGFIQKHPTVIFEDNKSCMDWANGLSNHKRSKHVNPKYHYTRQLIKHGQIQIKYCDTKNMIADLLTKSLGSKQFQNLSSKLLNQE
jgi:hypothetical protein